MPAHTPSEPAVSNPADDVPGISAGGDPVAEEARAAPSPAAAEFSGATPTAEGVRFRVWAPLARQVEVVILDPAQPDARTTGSAAPAEAGGGSAQVVNDGSGRRILRVVPLEPHAEGWHSGLDAAGRTGDWYKLRLHGKDVIPDPGSRFQPEGPHGPSQVVDATAFPWTDSGWQQDPRRPGMRELVVYELHVGTFTAEGTYRAAAARLPHLADLGVTAIELMPLAEFAGGRNWGYDGVCLFAPEHSYGTPDDLRALVDEAHRFGISVLLDVVYNHFGPDGNYLSACIGDYLDEDVKTPWGGAIRYGHPDFAPLRQMLVANVRYWMRDFHIDGFRLDATHAIEDESPVHVLQEVTSAIHAAGGHAIAEDSRNDATLCLPRSAEGGLGFDAVWADDMHHVLRVGQTRESAAYFQDFSGSVAELHEILVSGWLYQGRHSPAMGMPRGTPCAHLPPTAFVTCISNHDQTGNRAVGDRLHHDSRVSPEAYRALSALICLCPFTPMLFMGQEWAASTPFQFFTDHHDELGALITTGRRQEFAAFPEFSDSGALHLIPDPQSLAAFEQSKLKWEEISQAPHAQVLALYQACLRLRRQIPLLRGTPRRGWQVEHLPQDVLLLHYPRETAPAENGAPAGGHTLVIHLGSHPLHLPLAPLLPHPGARVLLATNEARFGGARESLPTMSEPLHLAGAEVLVLGWE